MRGRHGSAGQATVELAMVTPLLIVLVLGMVQLGVVVRDRVAMSHAARVASRAAVVDPSTAAARQAAAASTNLDPGRLSVRTSGGTASGDLVTVTVTYRCPTDVPLVGRFLGDVEFSERLVARVE